MVIHSSDKELVMSSVYINQNDEFQKNEQLSTLLCLDEKSSEQRKADSIKDHLFFVHLSFCFYNLLYSKNPYFTFQFRNQRTVTFNKNLEIKFINVLELIKLILYKLRSYFQNK